MVPRNHWHTFRIMSLLSIVSGDLDQSHSTHRVSLNMHNFLQESQPSIVEGFPTLHDEGYGLQQCLAITDGVWLFVNIHMP